MTILCQHLINICIACLIIIDLLVLMVDALSKRAKRPVFMKKQHELARSLLIVLECPVRLLEVLNLNASCDV